METAGVSCIKSAFYIMKIFGEAGKLKIPIFHSRNVNFYATLIPILCVFNRFVCESCHKRRNSKRTENKYTAKRLPTTRLGTYIENRVNNFLRKKEAESGEVHIRVVYTGDKHVEVKGGMKKR